MLPSDLAILKQLARYLACKAAFYEKYSNTAKAQFWRQREQALLRILQEK
jgi:hypothetical protein